MILIGQYDSPFVRRVGIALTLYRLPFEHLPWSVFGDGPRLQALNPLMRVPTLVLDDGEVLIESAAMLDHLDETVGPTRALIARSGPDRRRALRVCALATGLADKAVALVYERVLHKEMSSAWIDRCRTQIGGVLDALEADRLAGAAGFWLGDTLGHADIAVACALRFTSEAHQEVFGEGFWPSLAAHTARCEALEPFREHVQPFSVRAPKS